jgi:poly(hydroxyalkanoate) depolymerase family esterase
MSVLSVVLASMTQVTSFGSNPGALDMFEYVPDGLPNNAPLVVVLHGCTQSAAAMVTAGWNKLADQYHFAVVYPQQVSANNPVECFNWAGEYGDQANLERGMGENQSVMSMVDAAIATHHLDKSRVYITGFSAGGAFVPVMLSTWPDRFAAGAVMSGVAYRCATSVNGAYSCQNPGVTKTAPEWGDLVRMADNYSGTRPPVQLWQGASDTTVAPMNQGELVKQWTNVFGQSGTADETETIGQATHTTYKVNGKIVVEAFKIAGMSHAVVTGGMDCPATSGAFFEDHGICSTTRAAQFFGLMGGGSNGSGSNGSGSGCNAGSGSDDPGNPQMCGAGGCAASGGSSLFVVLAALGLRRWRRPTSRG